MAGEEPGHVAGVVLDHTPHPHTNPGYPRAPDLLQEGDQLQHHGVGHVVADEVAVLEGWLKYLQLIHVPGVYSKVFPSVGKPYNQCHLKEEY